MNKFEYFVDVNGKRQWKEYDENNRLVNCSVPDYKEWNENDSNGNLIYSKNSDGYEYWCKYDENNRLIYYKDHRNWEEFYKYYDKYYEICYKITGIVDKYKYLDYNDNLLYIKDADGNVGKCTELSQYFNEHIKYLIQFDKECSDITKDYDEKYDNNGNLIYRKYYRDGFEQHWVYDSNNMVYYKNSDGYEKWLEYNSNNKCTYLKDTNGYEEFNDYDSNGNCIHHKDSTGYEYWNKYDNNNHIQYKDSNGSYVKKEYDKNNRLIRHTDYTGYECVYEYDENGDLIHCKDSNGLGY